MKTKILALILVALMLAMMPHSWSGAGESAKTKAYTTHSPIRINSNSDFATEASNEGWAGSGTSTDPYIIESYEISGGSSDGIYIGNTTVYFKIRSCYIHDNSLNGIELYNVKYGKIENSIVKNNNNYQIYVNNTVNSNNYIVDTTVSGGNYGIYISNADTVYVHYYNGASHTISTLYIDKSSNIYVQGTWIGSEMDIYGSSNIYVEENTFEGNLSAGATSSTSQPSEYVYIIGNIFDNTTSTFDYFSTTALTDKGLVIENNTFNGQGGKKRAIDIIDAKTTVVIKSNTIENYTTGLCLGGVNYGTFKAYVLNNTISSVIPSWSIWGERVVDEAIIQNNTIYVQSSSTPSYGIIIYKGNYTIENNTINSNYVSTYGVASSGEWPDNVYVLGNKIYKLGVGADLRAKNSVVVGNNKIYNNKNRNLKIYDTPSATVYNNTIVNSSSGSGLILLNVSAGEIYNNNISGNAENGLIINETNNLAIYNNTIGLNANCGVYMGNLASNSNQIHDNVILENTKYGIVIENGTGNRIWNNTFYRNNGATDNYSALHIQACDDYGGNYWNTSGTPHGYGNYWNDWISPDNNSDGIVDKPYGIDGLAGTQDYYPHAPPTFIYNVSEHYISPNGDGMQDRTTIHVESTSNANESLMWNFTVVNTSMAVVYSFQTSGYYSTYDWAWNGQNYSGSVVIDGNYTIRITAYEDTAVNKNESSTWVIVDTQPPSDPDILTPVEGVYLNHAWANISWNWTDTNFTHATITILNATLNATATYYQQNITLSNTYLNISLPDGDYSVYISVWDIAGNENTTPYRNFVIDTTAPSPFSLISPNGSYLSGNATLTWNATSDVNMDYYLVAVYYAGAYHNYTTINTSINITLPSGEYSISWYVVAVDLAGNTMMSNETFIIYYDTIAPRNMALVYPVGGIYLNNMSVNFTWASATDFSPVHYIIEIYNASGTLIYTNTTNNTNITVILGNGNYNWRILAVDEAGNENATANTTFEVNTVPPSLNVSVENSTVINGNITVGDNITLNITTNGVQMRITNGSYDSGWIDYQQYFTLLFSTTGLYNITVYVKDSAGNINSTWVVVYLDASAPVISDVSVQHYLSFNTTEMVIVNATDDTQIKEYGYELNGNVFWFSSSQFTINLPNAEGNYTTTILVKDIFNHTLSLNTWIYEIQHKPTGSISVNAHLTNNASVGFTFSASDTVFNITGMWIKVDSGNWIYYNYTTSLFLSFTKDGNHTVYVKFVTNLGVVSNVYSTWIVIDTAPPTTSISGVPAYTNTTALNFTISGSDSLSGMAYFKVYYRINGGAWQFLNTYLPNQTAVQFTFTQEGTYEFSVIGFDKAGNHEDITTKATVIVDWTIPTLLTNAQNTTLTLTLNYTISWVSTDNNGIAYYLIIIYKGELRATPWKIINTTSTSILLTFEDNATYTIVLRAYDKAGNFAEKSLAITENYNYPPILKKTDIPQNVTAGEETTFYADAVDIKGDNLNYTWIIDNKTVGYGQYLKIKLPAGNHTLKLIVSDGVHTVEKEWNIMVKKAPPSATVVGGNSLWWIWFLLFLIVIIILVIILFKKKGEEGEKEEGLTAEEKDLLMSIEDYLDSKGGSVEYSQLVKSMMRIENADREQVRYVIDYAKSKGILTFETDEEGVTHVILVAKNVKFEEKKKEEGGEKENE